jgi:hypothetical protein
MKRPKKAQDLASPAALEGATAQTATDRATTDLSATDFATDVAEDVATQDPPFPVRGDAVAPRASWDDGDEDAPAPRLEASLTITLSRQLHGRMIRTAQEEGVPVAALAQELLAEGVTLRAWEIIERKSAMRGQSASPQPHMGGNANVNGNARSFGNHGNGNYRHGNRGGVQGNGNGNSRAGGPNRRPGGPNNAWMEDKAAFLEYVRNQEKRRR